MPKIKLSTLVSDMKGKSNGSVFSSNSGGVYFRNNPSGGGKKSAKWDKQKSNFSAISRSWKALTELEQQAWLDIVNLYPTKNAFGDVRIPSGFELYCRLNGALVSASINGGECSEDAECAEGYMCINNTCTLVGTGGGAGFPMLTVPLSPRSVPSVGYVGVNWSELWQMNPTQKLRMFTPNDLEFPIYLVAQDLIADRNMFGNQTFSFRFEIDKKQHQIVNSSTEFVIYSFIDVNGYGFTMYLKEITNVSFKIEMFYETATGSGTFSTVVSANLFSKAFHFAFVVGGNFMDQMFMYVDGFSQTVAYDPTGTESNPLLEFQHKFVNIGDYDFCAFYLSDFKYFKLKLLLADIKLLASGYWLGTEFIGIDGVTHAGGVFTNYGSGGASFNMSLEPNLIASSSVVPASFALLPNFEIEVENEGLFDMYLNIYASPPISWGKTGTNTNLKLLGSYLWDTETKFQVAQAYKNIFGNVPANSNVDFYVQAIDSSTGDMLLTKTKGKKNKPRFKAGADLTEKVN